MAEATRRWSWRSWLPNIGAAFSRFPVAVLLAGFFTAFKLSAGNPSEAELKVLGTLAASFLWVLAVDLFVESHRRSQTTRAIAWPAGIAAIALLFRFQWEVWFLFPLLFGALVLAVGLSAYAGGRERNESFWLFNHRLWLAALLALVGAGLFGGGLSIILETLNFLFGLHLPLMARAHLDDLARLHGSGQLAHTRAAELHGQDRRAADGVYHPRRRLPRQVRAGAAAPGLHRDPLRLCDQDRARRHSAQRHARQHDRRLFADRGG